MKKEIVYGLLIITSLLNFSFIGHTGSVLGKWEWKRTSPKDPLSIILTFKANGAYDIFSNRNLL